MCGIVGAVAQRNITPILIEGLKRLEYRGYDSCGVALHVDGQLQRSRSTSRVADLEKQIGEAHLQGFTGIAHTRWATHGAPASHNAHPHFSPSSDLARIALVHNGIIENHDELRAELTALGYVFQSQTDTEVIAHLVDHLYNGDLFETVQIAVKRLMGAYAIAVFAREEPHRVVAARQGSPLIVGLGQGENFVASDAMALAGTTDQIIYLDEGDVVD
ncbi:MAG: glutamine--fructose-6-phosphate aminotransferase, partial [Duganella sp.]